MTIRPLTGSPALARSRHQAAACRAGAKWPLRWTLTTASHSASDMFTSIRSRRNPALHTSVSKRPHSATACSTIARASSQSDTSPPLATASPPAAAISATTSAAASLGVPEPSRSTPRSFTTTRAPSAAKARAWARPKPRPAPVTITTRPSQHPVTRSPPAPARADSEPPGHRHPARADSRPPSHRRSAAGPAGHRHARPCRGPTGHASTSRAEPTIHMAKYWEAPP